MLGRSESTKTQIGQLRTCKAPWSRHWWPLEAPHCYTPSWIKDRKQSKQGLIEPCSVIFAGLEMAIADFFHWKNIGSYICSDCKGFISPTWKLMNEVVSRLHHAPWPNKKWSTKLLMKSLVFFGKNLNTSLTELSLTAIVQAALKMMMPFLVDFTFGM